jgi:hypothetical protein
MKERKVWKGQMKMLYLKYYFLSQKKVKSEWLMFNAKWADCF